MAKLICVGMYRELTDDANDLTLVDAIAESPQENEEKIVAYLHNSICLGWRMGFKADALDPSSKVALFAHPYTDGMYYWTSHLAHYVEKYHLRLPADFVAHMASRDWKPPTRDQVDADSLEV